jgi:hypothetical protein
VWNIVLKIVHSLNSYANLVLVLITTAYAWLTWRSLKAFRESTLRDREARHLEELKANVIQPIVSWITSTVFGRFTGQTPELLAVSGCYGAKQRQFCHTVDDPFSARTHLSTPADSDVPDPLTTWSSTESGRISRFLYEHTRTAHFPAEMREFDNLLVEMRKLTAAFLFFANDAAKALASCEIPVSLCPEDENSMSEWVSPHLLAAACIESLLAGEPTLKVHFQTFPGSQVLCNARNQPIAKVIHQDKVERWRQLGFEEVRTRWESENLPERVRSLLRTAGIVRQNIDELMFTHSLGVDCDLVSGKRRE